MEYTNYIPLYAIKGTIDKTIDSLGLKIPHLIDAIVTSFVVGSEEAEGIGSQSSRMILETPEAPK